MTDLSTRYGSTSPLARVTAWVLIVALVVGGGGYVIWGMIFHSTPEVRSRLISFEVVDEHLTRATLHVVRADEDTQASCRLQAVAADHAVVGEVEVPVISGPDAQMISVEIRTERASTSVGSAGCTAPGQARPR